MADDTAPQEWAGLCEDCPPVGYPTDKTRCAPCPRRTTDAPQEAPDDNAELVKAFRAWMDTLTPPPNTINFEPADIDIFEAGWKAAKEAPRPMTAAQLTEIIRSWLDADHAGHWGAFERALDAAITPAPQEAPGQPIPGEVRATVEREMAAQVVAFYRGEIGRLMQQAQHWADNGKPLAVHHRLRKADAYFQVVCMFDRSEAQGWAPIGERLRVVDNPVKGQSHGAYPGGAALHRYRDPQYVSSLLSADALTALTARLAEVEQEREIWGQQHIAFMEMISAAEARAEAAEARLAEVTAERDALAASGLVRIVGGLQAIEAAEARLETARRDALEEAAQAAEKVINAARGSGDNDLRTVRHRATEAIRALATPEKEPTDGES